MQSVDIKDKEFKLWGMSGAELELVYIHVDSVKKPNGKTYEVSVFQFTDADGNKYEMCVPFAKK